MTGNTLAACICFYNEAQSIKRCIDSLYKGVDTIICIDGRFPDYEDSIDFSMDGSQDIVESYPNTKLFFVNKPEVEKRNFYLHMCKVFEVEYGLMIDADEYVLPGANWKEFRHNCEMIANDTHSIYGVKFEYNHKAHHDTTPYPRLWFRPGQLEYYQRHNQFRHKHSGRVWESGNAVVNVPIIEGITLAGDDDLRDPEHIKKTYQYQVKLIEKEKIIRNNSC